MDEKGGDEAEEGADGVGDEVTEISAAAIWGVELVRFVEKADEDHDGEADERGATGGPRGARFERGGQQGGADEEHADVGDFVGMRKPRGVKVVAGDGRQKAHGDEPGAEQSPPKAGTVAGAGGDFHDLRVGTLIALPRDVFRRQFGRDGMPRRFGGVCEVRARSGCQPAGNQRAGWMSSTS